MSPEKLLQIANSVKEQMDEVIKATIIRQYNDTSGDDPFEEE